MSQEKQSKETLIVLACIVAAAIIVGGVVYFSTKATTPQNNSQLDAFAQCLKDSGAVFYGASWCSHCQNEKERFGNSKNLPYVECSTPDGQSQLQICVDKKIEGYPTWIFADDSRESGDLTLEQLSAKTGCQL